MMHLKQRLRAFWFITLFFFACLPVPVAVAQNGPLTVDLAQDHVDITTGFNGAHLTLFGVQEQEGDIAIVITGPRRDLVVRKKKRILGVWANMPGIKFKDVPGFYDYSIAIEEEELGSPEVLREAGIGMGALQFSPKKNYKDKERLKSFQDALIRNMRAKGMFPSRSGQIVFLSDKFFRTTLYLPPNVPTGRYKVQTFLMRDGAIIDVKETGVKVEQVGVNASIYRFASSNSFAYGVLSVMFAMMAGWLSNAIRRRL